MPTSWTKGDPKREAAWQRAKKAVRKQYPEVAEDSDRFYKLTMSIAQNMAGQNDKTASIDREKLSPLGKKILDAYAKDPTVGLDLDKANRLDLVEATMLWEDQHGAKVKDEDLWKDKTASLFGRGGRKFRRAMRAKGKQVKKADIERIRDKQAQISVQPTMGMSQAAPAFGGASTITTGIRNPAVVGPRTGMRAVGPRPTAGPMPPPTVGTPPSMGAKLGQAPEPAGITMGVGTMLETSRIYRTARDLVKRVVSGEEAEEKQEQLEEAVEAKEELKEELKKKTEQKKNENAQPKATLYLKGAQKEGEEKKQPGVAGAFLAGMDPTGRSAATLGLGREKKRLTDMPAVLAGGALTGAAVLPSATAGLVKGVGKALQARGGLAARLAGGARGAWEGITAPYSMIAKGTRATRALREAAKAEVVDPRELMRRAGPAVVEVPVGEAAQLLRGRGATLGATAKEVQQQAAQAAQSLRATGEKIVEKGMKETGQAVQRRAQEAATEAAARGQAGVTQRVRDLAEAAQRGSVGEAVQAVRRPAARPAVEEIAASARKGIETDVEKIVERTQRRGHSAVRHELKQHPKEHEAAQEAARFLEAAEAGEKIPVTPTLRKAFETSAALGRRELTTGLGILGTGGAIQAGASGFAFLGGRGTREKIEKGEIKPFGKDAIFHGFSTAIDRGKVDLSDLSEFRKEAVRAGTVKMLQSAGTTMQRLFFAGAAEAQKKGLTGQAKFQFAGRHARGEAARLVKAERAAARAAAAERAAAAAKAAPKAAPRGDVSRLAESRAAAKEMGYTGAEATTAGGKLLRGEPVLPVAPTAGPVPPPSALAPKPVPAAAAAAAPAAAPAAAAPAVGPSLLERARESKALAGLAAAAGIGTGIAGGIGLSKAMQPEPRPVVDVWGTRKFAGLESLEGSMELFGSGSERAERLEESAEKVRDALRRRWQQAESPQAGRARKSVFQFDKAYDRLSDRIYDAADQPRQLKAHLDRLKSLIRAGITRARQL